MSQRSFNVEILERLSRANIHRDKGITVLLSFYYLNKVDVGVFETSLIKQILRLNFVTYDHVTNTFDWKLALFDDAVVNFEWVGEWMDKFKKINPQRRGVKSAVIANFKTLFSKNPNITVEDVKIATTKYLSSIRDPQYCKKSHKFIYDRDGSMIEEYLKLIEESPKTEVFKDVTYESEFL